MKNLFLNDLNSGRMPGFYWQSFYWQRLSHVIPCEPITVAGGSGGLSHVGVPGENRGIRAPNPFKIPGVC